MSDMKNMIVLKDLPSNLIEEAFVVLKENKKIHKYQTVENKEKGKESREVKDNKEYIVKEAEMLIKSYTEELERNTPKWKNNMKKLERKYKTSIKINFFLLFTTMLGIVFSLI